MINDPDKSRVVDPIPCKGLFNQARDRTLIRALRKNCVRRFGFGSAIYRADGSSSARLPLKLYFAGRVVSILGRCTCVSLSRIPEDSPEDPVLGTCNKFKGVLRCSKPQSHDGEISESICSSDFGSLGQTNIYVAFMDLDCLRFDRSRLHRPPPHRDDPPR